MVLLDYILRSALSCVVASAAGWRQDANSRFREQHTKEAKRPFDFCVFFLVMSKFSLEAPQEMFLHTSLPRPRFHTLSYIGGAPTGVA